MNDRAIAGALGLEHRGSLLVILGGFDEAGYRKQSIGSLMFEQIARDCIERGDHSLDFTIGDEPYKLIFGGRPSPMWQIFRAGSPLGYGGAHDGREIAGGQGAGAARARFARQEGRR